MTDIQTGSEAPKPMESILKRMSVPLFLFSVALFGLLLASRLFLLPRFTNFTVAGQTMSPSEVAVYERSLNAQLAQLEENRFSLALPFTDTAYDALKVIQRDQPDFTAVRSQVLQTAARAGIETDQFVLHAVSIDASAGTVRVAGDVRNSGTRSMTLLAAFIEEMEKQSQFTDLVRPAFTRVTDADIGMHSPFVIEFTVAQAGTPALGQ